MWQRFTEEARRVIYYAQEEAQLLGQGYISTEHMLLGLFREADTAAAHVLEVCGAPTEEIRKSLIEDCKVDTHEPSQDMTLTPRAKRVIDLAYDEARNLNNNYIGSEHVLLGLVREGDGLAGRILARHQVSLEEARRAVLSLQNDTPLKAQSEQRVATPSPVSGPEPAIPASNILPFLTGGCLPEHLLFYFLSNEGGEAYRILQPQLQDVRALQAPLWHRLTAASSRGLQPAETGAVARLLAAANDEANGSPVSEKHILLALLSAAKDTQLGRLIESSGIGVEESRKRVAEDGS